MKAFIAAAFSRNRAAILLLAVLFIMGSIAYATIPKEAAPEIDIPVFTVTVSYPGISTEDSARLLVEPLERKLQSIDGLDTLTAQAGEGFAMLQLEFAAGFDNEKALRDVKDETEKAEQDLPSDAEKPTVQEVDLSLFPILTVALSGNIPERDLIQLARNLEDKLETLNGVLEVDMSGDREDLLEIIIEPLAMQSYNISLAEVSQAISNNNLLVTAGAMDTGAGRISVAIPGTIENIVDVFEMPVKTTPNNVVRVSDVAEVRRTFKDPVSYARIDGQPSIALDITKLSSANVIDVVDRVTQMVEQERTDWPATVNVAYMQNQADDVKQFLGDLENNVILAIILVILTVVVALGVKASLLVALAIPGSFLGGILTLQLLGITLNIVVLFALILVIGMLVDGAIVVVDLAERYRRQGQDRLQAYLAASQRMAWPIIASTMTTLAVFIPLLFWPGMAGQFMFYLPATVIITLLMSLLMALVFVPIIGSSVKSKVSVTSQSEKAPDKGSKLQSLVSYMVGKPLLALLVSLFVLLLSFFLYSKLGQGVNFFPDIEADRIQIQVQADGNLSVSEADNLVKLVDKTVEPVAGIERIYSRTIGSVEERLKANLDSEIIGTLQIDLLDWQERDSAAKIIQRIRAKTDNLPGIALKIEKQQSGPSSARPVSIEVSAKDRNLLPEAVGKLLEIMKESDDFIDTSSDMATPKPQIKIDVDREKAAEYGVDVATLGTLARLLTDGVLVGTYLPESAPEQVDIRIRYPWEERSMADLANLRIPASRGLMPIENFVQLSPSLSPTIITRVNSRNVQTIESGLVAGVTVGEATETLRQKIKQSDFAKGVEFDFTGELDDQNEAMSFLLLAFALAIFLMLFVLLLQLNSFFQSALVLSAIVFSLAGVLLALLVRQEPFSVVMSGIGIMALAGIVVNNNIVLIDAYNEYRSDGLSPMEAAVKAAMQRLNPVLLTATTTIVGLLPMVLGLTVDFFERDIFVGAPSGQYWIQLSTALVGGLLVATFITLLLTPAMLAWDGQRREKAN
ncbi:efflux RND transporter permease subunit [Idiomarina seosinensis]|uniref:MFS transporter n=1 Tax=Idiomarina seosinensis TaxID=281739 RepID=A0A432ZBT9_9GAMM|nr:efflux RND transporter permease subunit [Idiomarina seosinensis]RUO75384.1 MFS transporter [Idiomarina seosinensis]